MVKGGFSNEEMIKFSLKEFTGFLPADNSRKGISQCLKEQSMKGAVYQGRRGWKTRQRILWMALDVIWGRSGGDDSGKCSQKSSNGVSFLF